MNKRKLASALLAGALLFTSTIPASAAKATGTPTPHQVFYREEAGQTFAGKIDMEKDVTEVEAGQPAFSLSVQDGAVLFDSLYTSTRQSIRATCDGESVSQEVNLAVYDTLDIAPATGSAVLAVKDARTLKPVPGAKYTLYCGGRIVNPSVESNAKGMVSLDSLTPGSYELRQTAVPKGFRPASASVKFTVTGLTVSGGDKEIRTSGGREIAARENGALIAGPFSPGIVLAAENEKQIAGVTVTYENFGASLGKPGTEKSFDYVTLRAAQEEINHLKDEEEICGAVHIAYTLKEPACNLTQYLAEKPVPKPTPTPPAPSQGGASGSAGTTAAPAATPAPTPAATQAPPSVNPIATPAPTVEPSAEPEEVKADKRNLAIIVLDTDGKPVPGVTVGLFEPMEDMPVPASTADPADISQSLSNLHNQRETEKISQDPYKRSAALQAARTDEQGRASFPKAPATELIAVPVKVPDGYSTEKIPTEIPAGMEEDFTVTCPYIAVDLSVYSNATDSPVAGADAVLCSEDGDELASWVTAESPRRFIRVPKGEYTLRIKSKDGEDKISFSVGGDTPLQKVRAETYLPGIREESGTKLDFTGTLPLLPYVGGAALVLAGAAAGIAAFLRKRKRGRGAEMRKALAAIFAVALLGGSVCAGLWLAGFYWQGQEQDLKMDALRRLAASPIVTDMGQGPQETSLPENHIEAQEPPAVLRDFTALQEENPDCIGWVSIPGTPIDFPVMQSQDKPEFYLDHDFSREYDIYGLPFLDTRCSLDSGNLLVYGHHMNDGSMFSCLHKYQDKAYWQAHKEVVFETPSGVESYRIAAVLRVKGSYRAGEWSIFQPMDVDSQTVEEITTHRLYDTAVGIGPGDKLLTLVTCEYSQKNGRLAVIAVKE